MNKQNAIKQLALVGLMCFTVNAATIHVAKGTADSLVGKAIKNSAAKDTITVGKGTFIDTLTIDHPLTIIGVNKDSTIISRANHDSSAIPTVRITGKNIVIKNMTILGHKGTATVDSTDTLTSWPASDAVVMSAESVSIASCNLIGGDGIDRHSPEAARGGAAVIIKKASKHVSLKNDSIQGGMGYTSYGMGDSLIIQPNDTIPDKMDTIHQPKIAFGAAGFGLCVDTSSFISVDSAIIFGGNSYGMMGTQSHNPPSPGLVCSMAESVSVSASAIRSGYELYFGQQYIESFNLRDSTIVLFVDCDFYDASNVVDGSSKEIIHKTGVVLPFTNASKAKNSFAMRSRDNWSGALVLSCFLTKASCVTIDLLNAKGQAVSHIQRENMESGAHQFTVDLKVSRASTLSNSVYFLKVATSENRQCFRLISVR